MLFCGMLRFFSFGKRYFTIIGGKSSSLCAFHGDDNNSYKLVSNAFCYWSSAVEVYKIQALFFCLLPIICLEIIEHVPVSWRGNRTSIGCLNIDLFCAFLVSTEDVLI